MPRLRLARDPGETHPRLAWPPRGPIHETQTPRIRPFRFPLRTRWLIVTIRDNTTWAKRWRNLIYLVRG